MVSRRDVSEAREVRLQGTKVQWGDVKRCVLDDEYRVMEEEYLACRSTRSACPTKPASTSIDHQ